MRLPHKPIAHGASAAVLVVVTAVHVSCSLPHLGREVGDGGYATRAMIDGPAGLAVIEHAVYVAEMERAQIRRIDLATGIITTVTTSTPLDGTLSLSADYLGRLLVVEHSRVSRVDPRTGAVSTIAGIGTPGATGDGGPATEAKLWIPSGCTTDAQGNLYIADSAAKRIRRVDAQSGTISTFAGTGRNETSGDGGPAGQASFEFPNSVAVDDAGNVYVAQSGDGPSSDRIRRVDAASGVVTTVAGPETTVWLTDTERQTGIRRPFELVFDRKGGLLFIDPERGQVFRLDLASGDVRLLAGGGMSPADGAAALVRLANPSALAVTPDGAVIVAEYVGNRVRRIDMASGRITTLGGNGKPKRTYVIL